MIANYGLKDKIPEIQYQSLDIILKNHIQPMVFLN